MLQHKGCTVHNGCPLTLPRALVQKLDGDSIFVAHPHMFHGYNTIRFNHFQKLEVTVTITAL